MYGIGRLLVFFVDTVIDSFCLVVSCSAMFSEIKDRSYSRLLDVLLVVYSGR